ncbi:MAG: hypothetical protein NXI19_05140 [Alphaproteobacteria bacterium]|nr:hypothetical protein [Alphaproteobacteria bacterium]
MDQPAEIVDPIILIFLFLVFSIGAIGPVIFCVWGAKRAEKERVLAAQVESAASVDGQTDASNENQPLAGARLAAAPSSVDAISPAATGTDEKLAVNA